MKFFIRVKRISTALFFQKEKIADEKKRSEIFSKKSLKTDECRY